MIAKDLITKIDDIRALLNYTIGQGEQDDANIKDMKRICDTTLLDWQIEERNRYTLEDAKRDVSSAIMFDNCADFDRIDKAIEQLHKGVRNA